MQDREYLLRSIQIAKLGGKKARPNPHVGAVIVYNNRIIGEGYHEKFGGPHAEVNAVKSINESNKRFLSKSTIYVSLEPCCHTGNTPPCTDLILKHKIPRVCIAEIDPTDKVNRKGIEQLRSNGVKVDIIPIPNNNLTDIFRINNIQKRPFVQLKFAKSKNNYIGGNAKQIWLSNETSSVFTHKLRSETDAILVGTNTAVIDNPSLTLRSHPGNGPRRVVLDRSNRIPLTHTLLSDDNPTIIFTENIQSLPTIKTQIKIDFSDQNFIANLLHELFKLNIYHLMIEGGGAILKSFAKSDFWDEAVVINTPKTILEGIKTVNLNGKLVNKYKLDGDMVDVFSNTKHLN